MLRSLNSHLVGYVGLSIGGASVLSAVAALFKLLSDPTYLVNLYGALLRGHQHIQTPADLLCIAQLAGASFALIGGATVALLASYFGKPATVPSQH